MTQLAIDAWIQLTDELHSFRAEPRMTPRERLERALTALVQVGRDHPHLYRLMFSAPSGDPEAALRAVSRSQDLFLEIVADVVGEPQARRHGALLLSSAHGIADMERSGHLAAEKWGTTGEQLIETLVGAIQSRSGA
ncbi:TetR-like C-terminal domain-containing protein [Rhodococcus wratislaviensis]|uniref:TetR-like C-terminal domain-containing protein n=1 Tax=Rhodococcus wratislaviensis TaxID=44752 RepID=UPI0021F18CFC|nr:TetR-like C-terminal domain-containing protein [Rhodococcus wratislaviensis]